MFGGDSGDGGTSGGNSSMTMVKAEKKNWSQQSALLNSLDLSLVLPANSSYYGPHIGLRISEMITESL